MRYAGVLWLWAMLGACDDAPVAQADLTPDEDAQCQLATVLSDYTSTRISLLDAAGELCRAGVLHSGSAPLGLSTALSGDVVLGGPHPEDHITLVDRFPNGVITWLDPVDFSVLGQLNVNTGFAANPQDVAHVSASRAYVSRLETNPRPGDIPFDGGGDLLVVDLSTSTIVDRVDLTPWGIDDDQGPLWPRPGAMVQAHDRVWVTLQRLSEEFDRGGSSMLLGVSPTTGEVTDEVDLAPLKNCTALTRSPSGRGLWLGCTGVFLEGPEAQLAHSGVAYIDLEDGLALWQASAAQLGGRHVGLSIAALDDSRAYVTVISPLDVQQQPDGVYLVDRAATTGRLMPLDAPPYALGGMWLDPGAMQLLIPDGDPERPRIWRFDIEASGDLTALDAVDPDPEVGLPPRAVGSYRSR
ncbi:MAG: hypothetical protein ACE366_09015 [Bradymonadia bacterium]